MINHNKSSLRRLWAPSGEPLLKVGRWHHMSQTPPVPDRFHNVLAQWHAAAIRCDPERLFGTARSVGIIVPHPDDETLGCGGLIAAAVACGIVVTVSVLTDGSASHPGSAAWPPVRLARTRRREVRAAVARLSNGTALLRFGNVADGRLADSNARALGIPQADLFVTCWRDDPHPDHRAAYEIACAVAARDNVRLLSFPLWVLTTDLPPPALTVLCLDVRAQLARKQAALAEHRSQLGQLITDVAGFALDADLIGLFVRADELFAEQFPRLEPDPRIFVAPAEQ